MKKPDIELRIFIIRKRILLFLYFLVNFFHLLSFLAYEIRSSPKEASWEGWFCMQTKSFFSIILLIIYNTSILEMYSNNFQSSEGYSRQLKNSFHHENHRILLIQQIILFSHSISIFITVSVCEHFSHNSLIIFSELFHIIRKILLFKFSFIFSRMHSIS